MYIKEFIKTDDIQTSKQEKENLHLQYCANLKLCTNFIIFFVYTPLFSEDKIAQYNAI